MERNDCKHCCTKVDKLTVKIEDNTILDEISMHMHCNETTMLVGKNGAGEPVELPLTTPVSMNMWGFTADFLDTLEARFVEFLGGIAGNEAKAEFLLPEVVGSMLRENKAEVKVLTSNDRWFGVTYHEDKDRIRRFYEDLPINALVIIDEAQNYFSSRDFKEGFSADLIPWLTKHRHLGNDVVWITQNLESVDITFRRNTHLTYALRRAENLGLKNSAFNYIFDRADLDRRHLARKMYRPDPTIFKLYSSYQEKEVKENRKTYNVFLRSPFFWLVIVALGWFLFTVFGGGMAKHLGIGRKAPPVKEKRVEQVQKVKNDVQETRQEVSSDKCITRMATVHGEKTFYLSDGSAVFEPSGLGFCP